ncbi:hypothetical protein L4X63_20540 [Geomonas sp. Red32]|uniref:hypothetical protein n=1 Tax=Geomonas sp. Red32 TaxID=2912856 RepID=UPI00202CF965|nr:hypothetical protein [Geomonas sp. Red32]MCM0083974.1 hypothetical protein [Geomonas sp. Red32]
MSILDKITGRLQEKIGNPILADLVKDQNLKDLLVKREFRITQQYLQREVFDKAVDDELPEISITVMDGFAEIAGKFKKRLIPFAIPFSAVFTIHSMEFTTARKNVVLKLERVAPVDIDWLTRKIVERVPYLSCLGDLVVCDLNKVPKLAHLFGYRVKGISPWDYVTLKDLQLKEKEIIGKVGVVL